ncbi:hypothetical protein F4819DRAFT_363576 [Hypoxylon fuscum]|nr:hypothetical protein F4819DRAFT_363576 [Hypoxylon fuscum]
MDFMDELETMAQVAIQQPAGSEEPEYEDIKRWQSLFGYSYSEAEQAIKDHRSDLSRVAVSDAHWDMVRVGKELHGYDKEAYEHSCILAGRENPTIQKLPKNTQPSAYLFKLEGPLDSVEKLKVAAGLDAVPPEFGGTDDAGEAANFCKIDAEVKGKIINYLSHIESRFQPTFVRYSKAEKALSTISAYPTLGIDTTMPQHRHNSANDPKFHPSQNQYPVWYFFYGVLADSAVLNLLLGCDPSYRAASVSRGCLRTWGGKYKALVDAPEEAKVQGRAFLVETQEQEDSLRFYETDKYDVVRCEIDFNGMEKVKGLTFRFNGAYDQ